MDKTFYVLRKVVVAFLHEGEFDNPYDWFVFQT